MAPLGSPKENQEQAISWLWETFWLGVVLSILNVLAAGQCLSMALDKSFLSGQIVLLMGAWFFLLSLVFWLLMSRIRQGKIWPIYLIIANGIVGILSIILFFLVPRHSEQYGPSIRDFTENFNLSPNDAKVAVERFKTCASGAHMTFLEYLSLFISAGLISWTLYACFILIKNLSQQGRN
jgi:hypothetical protein